MSKLGVNQVIILVAINSGAYRLYSKSGEFYLERRDNRSSFFKSYHLRPIVLNLIKRGYVEPIERGYVEPTSDSEYREYGITESGWIAL